jgi:hypothetical protein
MLAACRSLLMAVMTLVKTMLKSRSASGSPGLVPVLVCTMLVPQVMMIVGIIMDGGSWNDGRDNDCVNDCD